MDDMINKFGFLEENTHYWISLRNGRLTKHSTVTIQTPNDTITKVEFSKTDSPLIEELVNEETLAFNDTFLPLFREINSTQIVTYKKYGNEYLAAVSPMSAKYYPNDKGEVFEDKRFLFTQVTDKQSFLRSITDRSELVLSLMIW